MNNKQFIDNLSQKNADYNNPEQAITTANLCDTISRDINTDSQRFIYELLQNADDASNQYGSLDVQIDFADEYVVISHNGETFSEIDIESISSAGDGTKASDSNKTGFKGIGFKSVFSHANLVIIKSGAYCFKFDKEHWKDHWNKAWGLESEWKLNRRGKQKDDQLKMPWQIIPIWTDLPDKLRSLSVFKEFNVSTIICHSNIGQIKKALNDLFSESQIVLFLRSKEVKITINTTEKIVLQKVKSNENTVLKRNEVVLSEWLVKSEQFEIPTEVQLEINADEKSPRKLKEAKRTEVSFAIQLDKDRLKAADKEKRLIFTYLPTSINYDFPFLVNASFLTDAGRQHLHQDIFWNNWIFKQIPWMFFSWVSELASKNSKYNKQFLSIIPNKLNGYSALENSFNIGYGIALQNIAFIPNLQGELLKVKDAIFDKTNISTFISKQTILNFINPTKKNHFSISSFIPLLEPLSTLSKLGVKIFDIDDLDAFLSSETFKNEHPLQENFKLISFLYDQSQLNKDVEGKSIWNEKLKYVSFIFDENQKLKKPKEIYFPTIGFSDDFGNDINIIHESIVSQINTNHRIKNWLESLGVKEPTEISFIEKTILGIPDYITKENVVQIGQYLFNAHKKGQLRDDHYDSLRSLKILTKENNLIESQNGFISNFYEPELKLESFYLNDIYVSEKYYSDKDLKSEWKVFWIKIGLHEDIEWGQILVSNYRLENRFDINFFLPLQNEMGEKYQNYSYYDRKFYFSISEFEVYHFSFVHLAAEYDFSKLFWEKVFTKKFDLSKNGKAIGYCGFWPKHVALEHNYFLWTLTKAAIFPTTQRDCQKTSSVFLNTNENHKIAGKYLPIFDFSGSIPEAWQPFLTFKKTFDLSDYLFILTSIWQDAVETGEITDDNKSRVELIYTKLSINYLDYFEQISNWGRNNKILAKDGKTFFYPAELFVVTVDGFKAQNLAFPEKINPEIIQLLRIFGVTIIDKITPTISNSKVEILDLKNKLFIISPLVALVSVEKSKSKYEWDLEFNRIKNKLTNIHFYETSEIYLSYGNEEDRQKRSSWAENDNFYYTGAWYSPRILDGLVEPLGKFLSIRYAERILTVLLQESFDEGLVYLKEKGYDITIIPDEYLIVKEKELISINQVNRDYNQSDADLGKKGELFVFEELKRIYSKKYNTSIEETLNGFKIGTIVEVFWRNISANTTENHDFKISELGKDIFIDSKATPYAKNIEKVALYISGNEMALMETAEKYLLARVFQVTTNPEMELIKLEVSSLND